MADICKDITPQDENNLINKLLPKLPSIMELVAIIYAKIEEIKIKYLTKLNQILFELTEKYNDSCPPVEVIEKTINIRNNIVENLSKVYVTVERISNSITKINNFLQVVVTSIKVAQGVITTAIAIQLFTPVIPASLLSKITGAQDGASDLIKKLQFSAEGKQRLVPIIEGLNSVTIAVQAFALYLKSFICKLDALDLTLLKCIDELEEEQKEDLKLIPLSSDIIQFVESIDEANEASTIGTSYKGFIFEIEEVPFSPTVNRKRALAKNQDGITLLQSELSFTSTPDVLIQELRFVIDRDNLRAD